jgi:hypothetical protein
VLSHVALSASDNLADKRTSGQLDVKLSARKDLRHVKMSLHLSTPHAVQAAFFVFDSQ